MKEIDWSKAPEGATHFHPAKDYTENNVFWRVKDGVAREVWVLGDSVDHITYHFIYDSRGNDCYIPEECFERPLGQAWSGVGLPPIGTVCDYSIQDGGWFECKIKYVVSDPEKDYTQFVVHCPHLGYEQIISKSYCKFRPIKTQEQIAAEEREKAINEMMSLVEVKTFIETRHLYEMMYDAGYRLTNKTEE